jgi:hypothetical protein
LGSAVSALGVVPNMHMICAVETTCTSTARR